MTQESEKKEWNEIKGKIKNQFGKLSDSQVEELNGHMDKLPNKIQKAYGYDQAKAEQESKAFNKSLKERK